MNLVRELNPQFNGVKKFYTVFYSLAVHGVLRLINKVREVLGDEWREIYNVCMESVYQTCPNWLVVHLFFLANVQILFPELIFISKV